MHLNTCVAMGTYMHIDMDIYLCMDMWIHPCTTDMYIDLCIEWQLVWSIHCRRRITFRAECECVEKCAEECQEYGWVRCGINLNVVPAAGCAIPKTQVHPFLGLANIYIGVVVAPA